MKIIITNECEAARKEFQEIKRKSKKILFINPVVFYGEEFKDKHTLKRVKIQICLFTTLFANEIWNGIYNVMNDNRGEKSYMPNFPKYIRAKAYTAVLTGIQNLDW